MIKELKETLLDENHNITLSENGAVMYETSGKNLLDLYWKTPSLRAVGPESLREIEGLLMRAMMEDKRMFAKFLFFLRDVRGGVGERNSFRNIYLWYLRVDRTNAVRFLPLVPEFGRWDDLVWLLCNYNYEEADLVKTKIAEIIGTRLREDLEGAGNISLLAKWLPSPNAGKISHSESKIVVKWLNNVGYKMNEAEYRKILSQLREKLKIVERDISAKTYENIDYPAVPSVANTYYGDLFLKYDEERRQAYLDKLASGTAKINAVAVFPHDIYSKVNVFRNDNQTELEEMWKSLPNYVSGDPGVLVVRDGSGSMCSSLSGSSTTALDVASAICLYFSQKLTGEFRNKFITFSSRPELVDLSACKTLKQAKQMLEGYNDCSNTDIEKTFDLILDTAVSHGMKQKDLPKTVLIASDMEFDCVTSSRYAPTVSANLFETIRRKFADNGYVMPKLVFWNVNSRTNAIPLKENDNGVILLSGYSVSLCKMVLSNETDPYKALVKELERDRYAVIEVA